MLAEKLIHAMIFSFNFQSESFVMHYSVSAVISAALVAFPAEQLQASPSPTAEATVVYLRSSHETRRYALWLEPASPGCAARAHAVTQNGEVRARAVPGKGILLRIGAGFSPGLHRLDLRSPGCDRPPRVLRQVVLGRQGPDHGWRINALVP
jgi:hypothetical protein